MFSPEVAALCATIAMVAPFGLCLMYDATPESWRVRLVNSLGGALYSALAPTLAVRVETLQDVTWVVLAAAVWAFFGARAYRQVARDLA